MGQLSKTSYIHIQNMNKICQDIFVYPAEKTVILKLNIILYMGVFKSPSINTHLHAKFELNLSNHL